MTGPRLARIFRFTAASWLFASAGYGADNQVCAQCHRIQTSSYPSNAMARALLKAENCEILQKFLKLTFQEGIYTYTITRETEGSIFAVSNGKQVIREPIVWAFGQGTAGQTYLFQHNSAWIESRVSFYKTIDALDITVGRYKKPRNLEEALGTPQSERDAEECFNCHATNALIDSKLHVESSTPGVQCVRCHEGADQHAAALKSGQISKAEMPSLKTRTTEEISNFCGQCHHTWEQIASDGPHDIRNTRYQPYRLTNSKCYDPLDKRISCVACHNPHAGLQHQAVDYDAKCTACHSFPASAAQPDHPGVQSARTNHPAQAKFCKTGAIQGCVNCHMPRIEIPGPHFAFADHMIRIVRPNEVFPD